MAVFGCSPTDTHSEFMLGSLLSPILQGKLTDLHYRRMYVVSCDGLTESHTLVV